MGKIDNWLLRLVDLMENIISEKTYYVSITGLRPPEFVVEAIYTILNVEARGQRKHLLWSLIDEAHFGHEAHKSRILQLTRQVTLQLVCVTAKYSVRSDACNRFTRVFTLTFGWRSSLSVILFQTSPEVDR